MLDDNDTAGIGHNSGAAALPYDLAKFQPLELRARDIGDAGAAWIKLPKVETEEQAQGGNDFLEQVKAIVKDTDAERRAQKKPHEDQGKAVDAAFKGLLDPLSKIADLVKPKLLAFTQEKARQEQAEKARLAEIARQEQEDAKRRLQQAQERGDVFGAAEAETAAKDAEKMAKAAAKPVKAQVKSASGGGRTMSVRKRHKVESIDNLNKAYSWFRDHERYGQAIRELFTRMAEAEANSAEGVKEIPGITFKIEESIA